MALSLTQHYIKHTTYASYEVTPFDEMSLHVHFWGTSGQFHPLTLYANLVKLLVNL